MKTPDNSRDFIEIIADAPAPGQDSIAGWIGKTFAVVSIDPETQEVTVEDSNGCYIIQPDEYRFCKYTVDQRRQEKGEGSKTRRLQLWRDCQK